MMRILLCLKFFSFLNFSQLGIVIDLKEKIAKSNLSSPSLVSESGYIHVQSCRLLIGLGPLIGF